MNLEPETENLNEYLKETEIIDYNKENIRKTAGDLFAGSRDRADFILNAYEFVRDKISHIIDCHGNRVVCKASEALDTGYGFCYAKSHLLAAILRCKGVPAGFCYQKLWFFAGSVPSLVLHGLNGIYIESLKKWIRADARGNKPGVNAQLSFDNEKLAFHARRLIGEKDFPVIYAEPVRNVIDRLNQYPLINDMIRHLPEKL